MIETPNLKLQKYELDDAANLTDGYNNSMDILDAYAGETNAHFPISSEDIEDGGINTVDIANGAVTENKLAADSVTSDKIASDAVGTEHIQDGSVTGAKIAADSVVADTIKDGAVTLPKIDANAFDATPTEDSANIPTSGGVYQYVKDAIGDIPDPTPADGSITRPMIADSAFDNAPTSDSDNLVTSNGVYEFVKNEIANADFDGSDAVMLAFGDSFGVSTYTDGPLWHAIAGSKLGIKSQNIKVFCVNGATFNVTSANNTIASQIENALTTLTETEKKNVKYITIVGGVNDNALDFTSEAVSCANTLSQNFPEARIGICLNAGIATLKNSSSLSARNNCINNASWPNNVSVDSCAYISIANGMLKSDNLHPTTTGSYFYGLQAALITRGITGACVIGNIIINPAMRQTAENVTFGGTMHGRILKWNIGSGALSFSNNVVLNFNQTYPVSPADGKCFVSNNFSVTAYATSNNGYLQLHVMNGATAIFGTYEIPVI